MYEKNDKRRLLWLMDCFLDEKITASTFCDEFYYSYDLEIDHSKLSKAELDLLDGLNAISSRFSPYKEDHLLDSKAFTTEKQLKEKIFEIYGKLKNLKDESPRSA